MKHKFTKEELDTFLITLNDLADWFEEFGNYSRAHACDILADGVKAYMIDILEETYDPNG